MTHEDILTRIKLLIIDKVEKEEEHILEIQEVIANAKESIAVTIYEANIKLAEVLKNS